jgi:uncharacterized protein (TIGR03437 family)
MNGPVAMVSADFDGDGILDLATSDTGSGVVAISLGDGAGKFRLAGTYPVPSSCQMASLFVGDFTSHHKTDLLGLCFFENQMVVLPSKGDGTFGNAIPTSLPQLAFAGDLPLVGVLAGINGTVGDFNRDGKLDVAVAMMTGIEDNFPPSTTIYLLPGNGDGTFGAPVPIPGVTQAITVVSGDFDGDGNLDLAYLGATGSSGGEIDKFTVIQQFLGILLGNGDGTFRSQPALPWPGPIFALSAADVNGDGFLDLYGAGAKQAGPNTLPISVVTVMQGDGKGNFKLSFSGQDPSLALAATYCLADFRGVGILDLLEIYSNLTGHKLDTSGLTMSLRQGDGKGGFGAAQILPGTSLPDYAGASVCADFNQDGLPDVAFSTLPDNLVFDIGSAASIPLIFQQLPAGQQFIALNANTPVTRTFSITNAASFASEGLAANSIATAFWTGPKTPSGIGITVKDSAGQTRAAQVFYTSASQINYLIPDGTALGQAAVTITGAPNIYSSLLNIVPVAPGIFNSNGLALAFADTLGDGKQTLSLVATPNASGTLQLAPIDVSAGNVYLLLFGTGIRNHANPATATIGSTTLTAAYAGAQGSFAGEDQINIALPVSLSGAGVVSVNLNVDGQTSNSVQIQIQ